MNPKFNEQTTFPLTPNMTAIEITDKTGVAYVTLNVVDSINGSIAFARYANKQDALKDYKFTQSMEGGKFVLSMEFKGSFDIFACPHAKVNISIPKKMFTNLDVTVTSNNGLLQTEDLSTVSTSLGAVSLKTRNGAINVNNGIVARTLSLESSDGALNGDKFTINGTASFLTSNGAVKLDTINAQGVLSIKSANGKLEVKDATVGGMDLKTSNGAIEVNGLGISQTWSQEGTLQTSNGKVEVNFASSFKGTYSASTNNGNVEVNDKSVDGRSTSGSVNGGGSSSLKITTSNGGIEIST
eukprot:TRINITY_DN1722_c1_g2_i2.p1 TRINITY_DN1722_c1_g2~~TRINITY_DN1722_c1_g2_i2.p1  ORF type:complete len:298 (-),score=111.74 TRINITY_DN1722_c1_g2_i2:16-909(-)